MYKAGLKRMELRRNGKIEFLLSFRVSEVFVIESKLEFFVQIPFISWKYISQIHTPL